MLKSLAICSRNHTRDTKRDGLIGGAVMIVATALFALLGIALKRSGHDEAAEAVVANSYLVAMNISMPFWLMKGQPWKAQAAVIGGTTAILIAIAAINFG